MLFSLSPLLSEVITHKLPCQNNSLNFVFKCFQARREAEREGERGERGKGVNIKKLPSVILLAFFHFPVAHGKFSDVCLRYVDIFPFILFTRKWGIHLPLKIENKLNFSVDPCKVTQRNNMQNKWHLVSCRQHGATAMLFSGLHLKD